MNIRILISFNVNSYLFLQENEIMNNGQKQQKVAAQFGVSQEYKCFLLADTKYKFKISCNELAALCYTKHDFHKIIEFDSRCFKEIAMCTTN
jgi:hypothetical protein